MHDLLRAYALDQAYAIDSRADRRETIDRFLQWYVFAASAARDILAPGISFDIEVQLAGDFDPLVFESYGAALEWFENERLNLVAGARSAMEAGLHRRAWELAVILGPVHASVFTFDDWSTVSEIAVAAADGIGDPGMLAVALDNRGSFFFRRGRLDEATAAHSRALAIRMEAGRQGDIIMSLNALGRIFVQTRWLSAAVAHFADAAQRALGIDDHWWTAIVLSNLAQAQLELGSGAQALETIGQVRQFFGSQDDHLNEGNALWLQSWAYRLLRDPTSELTVISEALRIAEDTGNRMWEALWLIEAARVHLALGDTAEAMRCCRLAASLQRQIGDHGREAMALDCTGEVFLAMGNAEDAAAFHREAARMHRQLGDRWQEALATIHLADAGTALGQEDASRDDAAHALRLLQEFTDDRAERLKSGLRSRLG